MSAGGSNNPLSNSFVNWTFNNSKSAGCGGGVGMQGQSYDNGHTIQTLI